ncbi:Uncharacterized protein FWK35_00019675 [Aphis craccivora]|uniref:Uncharacterized protein n=1 Tax=Aphis craccivora TaxID=307492 RepID=A0A6G0YAN3_APHCR|nr:Uncharacterized protein FWK35_00019675 [Aphis craccivora]
MNAVLEHRTPARVSAFDIFSVGYLILFSFHTFEIMAIGIQHNYNYLVSPDDERIIKFCDYLVEYYIDEGAKFNSHMRPNIIKIV